MHHTGGKKCMALVFSEGKESKGEVQLCVFDYQRITEYLTTPSNKSLDDTAHTEENLKRPGDAGYSELVKMSMLLSKR